MTNMSRLTQHYQSKPNSIRRTKQCLNLTPSPFFRTYWQKTLPNHKPFTFDRETPERNLCENASPDSLGMRNGGVFRGKIVVKQHGLMGFFTRNGEFRLPKKVTVDLNVRRAKHLATSCWSRSSWSACSRAISAACVIAATSEKRRGRCSLQGSTHSPGYGYV